MTTEELEARLCLTHASGRAAGVERVAIFIRDAAGDAFKDNNDRLADALRRIANKVDSMHAEEEGTAEEKRAAVAKFKGKR